MLPERLRVSLCMGLIDWEPTHYWILWSLAVPVLNISKRQRNLEVNLEVEWVYILFFSISKGRFGR